MEESTLRWPTDKEREEMEEVCSIGEVPQYSVCLRVVELRVFLAHGNSLTSCYCSSSSCPLLYTVDLRHEAR